LLQAAGKLLHGVFFFLQVAASFLHTVFSFLQLAGRIFRSVFSPAGYRKKNTPLGKR
jgi:hypothetical protein